MTINDLLIEINNSNLFDGEQNSFPYSEENARNGWAEGIDFKACEDKYYSFCNKKDELVEQILHDRFGYTDQFPYIKAYIDEYMRGSNTSIYIIIKYTAHSENSRQNSIRINIYPVTQVEGDQIIIDRYEYRYNPIYTDKLKPDDDIDVVAMIQYFEQRRRSRLDAEKAHKQELADQRIGYAQTVTAIMKAYNCDFDEAFDLIRDAYQYGHAHYDALTRAVANLNKKKR